MAHTVDEVSDTLGVPRPTLYRYIREYSVPHLRRAGKIYVPEESFDRIREIRELHKEGLDTDSVRRRLQEGSSTDAGELAERLDRISETLEDLGGDSKPASNGSSTAQALQTVLARQTLLISEVSNLTEMMEDLLAVNGLRRKVNEPETITRPQETFVDDFERHPEPENGSALKPPASPVQPGKFGSLTRQRRRGILVVMLALLTVAGLIATLGYGGAFTASPEPLQEEVPASSEENPAGDSDASSPSGSETTSYAEEDYQEPAREQPSDQPQYPAQEVAPEPFYQEQPIQQEVAPEPFYQEQPVPQPRLDGTGVAPGP